MRSLHVVAENLLAYKFVLKKVFGQEAQVESLAFFFCSGFFNGSRVLFFIRLCAGDFTQNDSPFHQIARKRIHARKNQSSFESRRTKIRTQLSNGPR